VAAALTGCNETAPAPPGPDLPSEAAPAAAVAGDQAVVPEAAEPEPLESPADGGGHNASGAPVPFTFEDLWQSWTGDLDAMVERRIVRVVTPYGGYQFYYHDGKPRGATWELLQRFEKYLNGEAGTGKLTVHVVVIPLGRDQLIPALLDGHADLIAGDLTITDDRTAQITFARPLLENVNEVLVTGPGTEQLSSIDDLAGRQVVVRKSSSYFEHLEALATGFENRGLEPPELVVADELLEAEDILEMVNNGAIPITVMDDYKAEFWSSVFPDITVRKDLVVNSGGSIAWAMRPDNPGFAAMLDGFLRKFGKGTMIGNDTYNRYLADASSVRCSQGPKAIEDLQELVDIFRKYGDEYEFDWLMLAAQGFQESGLQQDRRSSAGAVGVMQIKPSTAKDPNVGIKDIDTADGNIHAGAKYMRFLADRYFPMTEHDDLGQWLFSLAAYNAGPARIARLRKEAGASGYDPDRWFNNVEIIAARRIGPETVTYVSNVFKYFVGYELTLERALQRSARFGDELAGCRSVAG
jgi:membrane-bound lytic murein transglycosylase MltF